MSYYKYTEDTNCCPEEAGNPAKGMKKATKDSTRCYGINERRARWLGNQEGLLEALLLTGDEDLPRTGKRLN